MGGKGSKFLILIFIFFLFSFCSKHNSLETYDLFILPITCDGVVIDECKIEFYTDEILQNKTHTEFVSHESAINDVEELNGFHHIDIERGIYYVVISSSQLDKKKVAVINTADYAIILKCCENAQFSD